MKTRKMKGKGFMTAGISVLVMLMVFAVMAQAQEVPKFKIGGIPSQAVWHGTTLQLMVYSDISGAAFSKTVPDPPAGKMAFNTSTGLFTYTPAATDKQQFFVKFTATGGGQSASQEVEINPTPHLPPEQTVFGIDPKTYPDAEYTDYFVVNDVKSEAKESFNNVERYTRSVSISGKTLVFEKNFAKNTLYNNYNNNEDIKNFSLFAETVIIRSPLNLPQTNVMIKARELRFEDVGTEKACINTTPKRLTTRPAQSVNGSHGLTAGNVTLHIEKFYSNADYKPRFILNGGNGQPAGLGKDGKNGTEPSQPMPYKTVHSYTTVVYEKYEKENKCCIWDACWPCGWETETFHSKAWPPNGENAISGGKPGNAGNGGNFSSNVITVNSYISQSGGKAGEKAPDCKGGAAGEPVKSYWVEHKKSWSGEHFDCKVTEHISTVGTNATSPSADIPIGKAGTTSTVNGTMSWFTPFALKAVVSHAKDAYLQGHLDKIEGQTHNHKEVREILEDYIKQVETYKSSAEWANLSDTEQYEFLQLKGEMEILLHRIYTNLDYFCNPAGWTPMLSFEVTMSMFENEIDRGIRVLYLTYWLGNKASNLQAKISGLENARGKLRIEIEDFRARYSQINDKVIPSLQTEAEKIVNEISYLQSELQLLEQRLLADAEANLKGDMWRQAAKILGTICTICPIGQPVVGAIGTGLTMIANYDPNNPFETIQGLWDLGKEFNDEAFKTAAASFEKAFSAIDPGKYDNAMDYVKQLENLSKPLNEELNKIQTKIEGNKASKNEIEAELARLKANCPEYQELIEKIRNLMVKKEMLAQQLANAMQETTNLSNGIIHNLLAIDGFNQAITQGNSAIDSRAVMYLKEMEKRAKERLLRYHYYVSKAYAYRMLEGYPGELNLNSMFEKFKTLASSDGNLSQSDYDALKALYEEQLSTVIDTIYKKYIANPPAKSALIRFELDQKRLDELNNDKMIILNLGNMGIFQPSEENVRIVDFNVYDIETEVKSRSYCRLDLTMTHSGISKLAKNGQIYLFRHYNNDTEHPIEWQVNYDCKYDKVDVVKPSVADVSLLKYLMGKKTIPATEDNIVLFSRPSAWADITVAKSIHTDENPNVIVKKLVFEIQYDFVRRPSDIRKLEVQVSDKDAKPYFTLSTADKNSRQDGMGEFQRTYTSSQTVTVTAPEQYGNFEFESWTDSKGNLLGTNRVLSVTISEDKVIKAQYSGGLSYSWYEGEWTACNNCTQTRIVECRDSNNNVASDNNCTPPKPAVTQSCCNAAVRLTMDDVCASPGSTDVPLVISLDNAAKNVASLQFSIRYDSNSGIHANGKYELTSRTQGFSCSVMPMESGTASEARVLLYNTSGGSITAGTGQILKIMFNVDATATLPATLNFKECTISDVSAGSVSTDYTDTAKFLQTANGDMNGDGKINILDLQKLINCILSKGSCDGGDLNGDGKYNILDLQKLINKIINPSSTCSKHALQKNSGSTNILTLPYIQLQQNKTGTFGLNLTNEDTVAAMQISFIYDSTIGFTITGVNLTSDTTGFDAPIFQVNNSDPHNVEVAVMLYSMSDGTIFPGTGNILEFSYETANDSSGISPFKFKEALLSDQNGNLLNTVTANGKISSEMGDIDRSGTVDLNDAIIVLQILSGIPVQTDIYTHADVNGDEKIGAEELSFILQVVKNSR